MTTEGKLLIMCALPRVGSSVFVGDMWRSSEVGEPREYFNPGRFERTANEWGLSVRDLAGYCDQLQKRTRSSNGVVGVKLMVRHLRWLAEQGMLPAEQGRLRALVESFGQVQPVIVRVSRHDKLRQAISLMKARQTGKWGSHGTARGEATFDEEALTRAVIDLVKMESLWDRELEASGMEPDLSFVYEEHLASPEERYRALVSLLRMVGSPDPEGAAAKQRGNERSLERQADETTEAWVNRFIGWARPPGR